MQKMSGRFAAIVYPGEHLYVEMWKIREDGGLRPLPLLFPIFWSDIPSFSAETVTVAYQSRVRERKGPDGKDLVVMSQGSAICRKKGLKDTSSAKL